MAVTDRRGAWPYAGRPKSAGWLTSIATLAVLAAISPALAQNVTATGDIDPAPVNAPIWDVFAAIIGNSGTGVLNIEDGGEVSGQHGYLGLYSGSSGTATVTGTGSSWDTTYGLNVGYEGTGVLNIEDGGQVSDREGHLGLYSGSSGTATVTGTGSSWDSSNDLYVGDAGTGVLNIEDGGQVSDQYGYLAFSSGSSGTATVTGAGSSWDTTYFLFVGYSGTGVLNIEDGGQVSDNWGFLGDTSGSSGTATVTGAGSSWDSTNGLTVGFNGTGVLNIEDGGQVSSGYSYIGLWAGSSGTATVTGAGSSWDNTAKLYVGEEGTGVLTIEDGGVVRVDGGAGQIDVARQAWSSGTINIGAAAGHGAVAAGTLNVETLQFGSGTGTLVFNHAGMPDGSDLSFDAEISGLGAIDHLAGTTVLTGDSSGFSGTTTISGGSLMLGSGATLGGVVNVGAGGTLGGTGMLGVTTIAAGGIHAPGHSIGTQTIDGDYTNHGTLVIEANPTSSDILVVNGAVDIAGADLSLLLTPTSATSWDIANSPFTYTIIANDDADAVTGQFASTSNVNQLLFLDASLDYAGGDGNDVALLLTRNTANFSGVAGTANQSGAAQAIESLGSGPLYDAIVTQTDDDIVRASFDALSGEIGAAARGTLTAPLQKMADAVNDRLLGASGGLGSAPVLAYGPGGPGLAAADTPLSVAWGSAFGNWGQSEDAGNAAGLSTRGGGLTGGIDGALGDWRLGLMAGYAGAAFAADDRASTGSSDSYSLGVYGGREWGALAFRSSLTASAHSLATSRDVAIPGFTDRLSADYNARSLQAFAELGYRFDVSGATSIEPFANLNQVLLDTDGYSESGGAAALTSAADTSASTFTTIGLRASHKIAMGTVLTTIRAMVGWRHGFGDLAPTSTMAFSGSTPFAVTGAQTPTNTALLSTGLDLNLSDDLTIGLGYAGRFADGTSDNTASATVAGTF